MAKEIDYKVLNKELEGLLAELESGDVDIDHAIKQYKRGMQIVGLLETYLATAENKINKVKADFNTP